MRDLDHVVRNSYRDPMTGCPIYSSFPSMLFIVYKYADSFEKAILASANAGGENVARGAILGCLLGAAHGFQSIPEWAKEGLYNKTEIENEITSFMKLFVYQLLHISDKSSK